MSVELEAQANRVAEEVRSALEPAGWSVSVVLDHLPRVGVDIEHELSPAFYFSMDLSTPSHLETLQSFLAKFEFQAVAARPAAVTHADLLRALRGMARSRRWERDELLDLAMLLGRAGVFTEEEAEWLAFAGPAWDDSSPPAS
jgi:hypothetical protein